MTSHHPADHQQIRAAVSSRYAGLARVAQAGATVTDCGFAGALSRTGYFDGLTAAGFADVSVTFTTEAAPGIRSAILRAVKPIR